MGRFFDHGDLRFVILKLIAEQPSHGYELIKAIEQASGGAYSPSPGVIYPTLTLLEELGYVTAAEEGGGKKLYTLAPEGEAFLKANQPHVDGLTARMAEAAARSTAGAPQILRAMENLKMAMRLKLTGAPLGPEQVARVAQVLDEAAHAIEQL
jgi:DNA-binding PadR family transcriptional regulator